MNNIKNIFLNKVSDLLNALDGNENLVDADLLTRLKKYSEALPEQYEKIMNINRNIKLGIVGRVKAGKSSFLNALLFEGQDRLPKAATPMTAALTRLNYAPSVEDQQAIVHYYSLEEWAGFEQKSTELQQLLNEKIEKIENEISANIGKPRFQKILANPIELDNWKDSYRRQILSKPSAQIEYLKNCTELVEMARKNGVSPRYLKRIDGKDQYIIPLNADNSENLFANLNEYVGANGRYTPFVKYIELKLHDKRLNGIEVVDTPGLNDPVTSRVDVTNRFLRECDAVLLLSGVSHFLDANDANLVGKQIREASIKRVHVVGTMIDIGLLECPHKNVNLQQAYSLCKKNYQNQAFEFSKNLFKNYGEVPKGMALEDKPQLVSSIFYSIARKLFKEESLNKDEQHVLNRLNKTYPGYDQFLKTSDDFMMISGFSSFKKQVYERVRADKENILQERVSIFLSEQPAHIARMLEDMAISIDRRVDLLEKNDWSQLKDQENTIKSSLQNSRLKVRDIFEELKNNAKHAVRELKMNMRETMRKFDSLKVDSDVRTNQWSEGFIFKEHHSEVYTVYKASASEVAGHIESYGLQCTRMISNCINDIFNRERLERQLRNAIYDTFQSVKADSNNADIIGPVQALISEIGIPEIDYSSVDDFKCKIFNKFSSEVRDSEIEELRMAQTRELTGLYNNYAEKIDKLVLHMNSAIDKNSSSFVDNVCDRVTAAYNELQEQLKDKEKNIQRYKDFSSHLNGFKKEFQTIGG